MLTRGLHEITSLLVTEFTLDDVLRVILETIYRALGVGRTRAFFLLKDPTAADRPLPLRPRPIRGRHARLDRGAA